ncbi:MAG TPA: hypothetical protein VHB51_01015 [Candidatus Saccharimonadales bacterium]|nr:hypothetical protein [Candidatus Saccharimonadales bacterium]
MLAIGAGKGHNVPAQEIIMQIPKPAEFGEFYASGRRRTVHFKEAVEMAITFADASELYVTKHKISVPKTIVQALGTVWRDEMVLDRQNGHAKYASDPEVIDVIHDTLANPDHWVYGAEFDEMWNNTMLLGVQARTAAMDPAKVKRIRTDKLEPNPMGPPTPAR